MHMSVLPFNASQAPENFYHIVINDRAYESVGVMPTGCRQVAFVSIAKATGYAGTGKVADYQEIKSMGEKIVIRKGSLLYEIPVGLSRLKEAARENKGSAKMTERLWVCE